MNYLDDLIDHCHAHLCLDPAAAPVRALLHTRGYVDHDLFMLRLGWAGVINLPGREESFELYNCLVTPQFEENGTPYGIMIEEIRE